MKKPLISPFLALLLTPLLLLAGCRAGSEGNLVFCNDSDTPVGLVEIQRTDSSGGGCRADGEPIGRGETLSFLEDPDDAPLLTLRVYDAARETVLAEGSFSLSFAEYNTVIGTGNKTIPAVDAIISN